MVCCVFHGLVQHFFTQSQLMQTAFSTILKIFEAIMMLSPVTNSITHLNSFSKILSPFRALSHMDIFHANPNKCAGLLPHPVDYHTFDLVFKKKFVLFLWFLLGLWRRRSSNWSIWLSNPWLLKPACQSNLGQDTEPWIVSSAFIVRSSFIFLIVLWFCILWCLHLASCFS